MGTSKVLHRRKEQDCPFYLRAGSRFILALVSCFVAPLGVFAQSPSQGVFTYHNDLARTGQNLNETILTPANVNSASFGKKFFDPVDASIYGQPLYVANLAIPGRGTHNVVFVATENDTVYAFDADTQGPPLWQTSLLVNGGTAVPSSDVQCNDLVPLIGVTGTPVIDPTTNTLYVVAKTKEGTSSNPSYFHRLHALDITTGAEKFGGPVDITATVSGTGAGGDGTSITFDPLTQLNRFGLALANGVVYVGFGSHCDNYPYHGWVIAYDAGQLTQAGVFISTPNGESGGIWQAGGSLAVDASNNFYVMTGNGTFDADQPGGTDLADSFLKLSQNGTTLAVADYFTPFDQATMQSQDIDLGSGGPMVLPDQTGTQYPHLLVGAGKEGTIYLLNRDNLGQYCSGCTSDSQIVQSIPGALVGNFDTPAYWNNTVYFLGRDDVLKAFSLANGLLSTTPTSQGSAAFNFPGATPSVSANGSTNGIVWTLQTDAYGTNGPAVLHANDASNVANELYNSTQAAGSRDTLGAAVKFTVPTVVNGQVFVGTANELDVLGLLNGTSPTLPTLTSLSLNPSSVTGGSSSTGTVTLSGPAPNGGAVVSLTSSNTGVAAAPSSVTIPDGSTSANFMVSTNSVSSSVSVTISAFYNSTTQTSTLTVNPAPVPPSIASQPADQTVVAGQTATFSATASGTAPLGYQWQKNGAPISGANSASYTTPPTTTQDNGAQFTVVVSNSAGNATSNPATLTVTPAPLPTLTSLTLNPSSVVGGVGSSTGTVTLSGPAPGGGAVVSLSSSNPSVARVPTSVVVPPGATSVTFTVSTSAVFISMSVTISGSYNNTTQSANLSVLL